MSDKKDTPNLDSQQKLRNLAQVFNTDIEKWERVDLRERIKELEIVCAELYQVIGSIASQYNCSDHPEVQRALDNASDGKLTHKDLLPWPKTANGLL